MSEAFWETGWVVFRFSDDMPYEFRPPELDGLWINRDAVPETQSIEAARQLAEKDHTAHLVGEAVAYPTDRTEVDAQGRLAQVWEIRPLWKIDESPNPKPAG